MSVADIIGNPKNFKTSIDAAQLPRVPPTPMQPGINTNYAEQAGLIRSTTRSCAKAPRVPYVNVTAFRTEDKDKPWVKALVEAYHSTKSHLRRYRPSTAPFSRAGKQ